MTFITPRLLCCLLSLPLLGTLSGCGETPKTAPTETSLRKLATHYGMFVSAHKGQGPKSEAELKAFIAQKSPDADQVALFRSDRDGQPYVILYGTAAGPTNVIAHEKDGVNGQRFVALGTTEVRLMDEAAFKQASGKR